jgi:hypothetical protein
MQEGDQIKFTRSCRYDWGYKKGDFAKIKKVLVEEPLVSESLYVVELENGELAWTTTRDFIAWPQLALFDAAKPADQ